MPVLPGHKYIGPGNSLDNGEPIDVDDQIARRHDHAYNNAENTQQIVEADEFAIAEFWGDFKSSGNFHSALGAAGIGLKYAVEKVVGVQYPRVMKRVADSTSENNDATATKKLKAGGGQSGSGKGGSDGRISVIPPIPRHIGLFSHTIDMVCNSFEEIGSGLYILPLQVSPRRFLMANHGANARLMAAWRTISTAFSIDSADAILSNFLFMQDAFTVAAGTPETTVAPTQSAYILSINLPRTSAPWQAIRDDGLGAYLSLHPQIMFGNTSVATPTDAHVGWGIGQPQLAQFYDSAKDNATAIKDIDISHLTIREGSRSWSGQANNTTTGQDDFLAKMHMGKNNMGSTTYAPSNFDANYGFALDKIGSDGVTNGYAKLSDALINTGTISYVQAGDVLSLPITMNCAGAKLMHEGPSDPKWFTTTGTHSGDMQWACYPELITAKTTGETAQNSVFTWPCEANPWFSKGGNTVAESVLNAKLKQRAYTLLAMAPMKDSAGKIVKQRASCLLQQRMTMTMYFRDDNKRMVSESHTGNVWDNENQGPDEDHEASGRYNNFVKDGMIPRPSIFTIPTNVWIALHK